MAFLHILSLAITIHLPRMGLIIRHRAINGDITRKRNRSTRLSALHTTGIDEASNTDTRLLNQFAAQSIFLGKGLISRLFC